MKTVATPTIEIFDIFFYKLCCYINDDTLLNLDKELLLKQWIQDIRQGKVILTNAQSDKLTSVNFDPGIVEWIENYKQLKEYWEKGGTFLSRESSDKNERRLYLWLEEQKVRIKYEKLSEKQIELLVSLLEAHFLDLTKEKKVFKNDKKPGTLKKAIEQTELATIKDAIARCSDNKTKAAAMLGIDRKTLYNKMEAYQIKH